MYKVKQQTKILNTHLQRYIYNQIFTQSVYNYDSNDQHYNTYKIIGAPPMIDVEIYPRYMAHQLRTQINATVVGKVVEINKKKGSFTVETDPEAKLNVQISPPEQEELGYFVVGKFYEVRGVCRSGKQIEMRGYTCFGSQFDLASYNQMVQLATKEFKSIFYP